MHFGIKFIPSQYVYRNAGERKHIKTGRSLNHFKPISLKLWAFSIMGGPIGNQFWKLRSTHGRDLIFSSPEILWQACIEYFEATDVRKWVKKDWVGKDAVPVDRETEIPYTKTGLFVFLDIDNKTWELYKHRDDFIQIVTRVEQIIYTQKIEGASVGAFNANIVARELGLKDVSDVNVNDSRKATADLFPLDGTDSKSES